MSSTVRPPRPPALVRRRFGFHTPLRALVGAAAVAAFAGCGLITEAEESTPDDLSGSYVLTHYNEAPVPAVTDEVPTMVEELQGGDVALSAGADSTFEMALVWRDTFRDSGTTQISLEYFRGTFTKSGTVVRLRITEEDGEVEDVPWTVTADLRAGVLRADFGDELSGAVLTFRKE